MQRKQLFAKYDLAQLMSNRIQIMIEDIKNIHPQKIKATSVKELVADLVMENKFEPIELNDSPTIAPRELTANEMGRPDFHGYSAVLVISLGYKGDPNLFEAHPREGLITPPEGDVLAGTVVLEVPIKEIAKDVAQKLVDEAVGRVRMQVENIAKQLASFPDELRVAAEEEVSARKTKLESLDNLSDELGQQ